MRPRQRSSLWCSCICCAFVLLLVYLNTFTFPRSGGTRMFGDFTLDDAEFNSVEGDDAKGWQMYAKISGRKVHQQDGEDSLNISSIALQVLHNMCKDYDSGLITGDLCNRVCYYEDEWEVVETHVGHKFVIVLEMGGQKLVLKTSNRQISEFDNVTAAFLDDQDTFESHVVSSVNQLVRLGFPMVYRRHLMQLLWSSYGRQPLMTKADMRSLWALLQQDEYVTFSVLPLARVFPKVQGTCGGIYAVEYLVPFKMKAYYLNLKAKILVHLMGTLKLFYEFLNEPLHWCDVQFDNFGLSADYPKRFMLMDGDMVFTESRLTQLLGATHCEGDDDCRLMDCEAKCNTTTKLCSARTNDNVEVFCSKLVSALFPQSWSYKTNRYIAACHNTELSNEARLKELRVVWAWSLPDV